MQRRHVAVAGVADGVLALLPAFLRKAFPDWMVEAAPGFALDVNRDAAVLIHFPASAAGIIAAAESFAALDVPGDRLVLSMAYASSPSDWQGQQDSAILAAFTRHAALAWAPRGIRVNRLLISYPAAAEATGTVSDVAGMVAHMWGWQSMTGQTLQLEPG